MWLPHRILRAVYAVISRTGIFSTPTGQATYECFYERYKLLMEGGTINALCKHITPNSLVIDVGANIGIYTNVFNKSVGKAGKVVAIEADPINAASVRRRFFSVPSVEVIESAASDQSGICRLQQDPYNPAGHVIGAEGIEVSSITLDEIVERTSLPLSFIKIDVEGAEPLVIKGAAKSIKKYLPTMYIEYSPDRITRLGGDPTALLKTLCEFGYQLFSYQSSSALSIEQINQQSLKRGYVDILALAPSAKRP